MIPFKDDNPKSSTPFVNYFLIGANLLAFAFQVSLGAEGNMILVRNFGTIPAELTGGGNLPDSTMVSPYANFFSSMFLHGGLLHLLGNMLYLWIFGDNVEDALGHIRYAVFYLVCGLAAAATQVLFAIDSTVPMIGASGAIAGVLGAYMMLFPHARVHTLVILLFYVTVVRLPALLVLGFWIVIQILNGMSSPLAGGGVAWFAHIGGFFAGVVIVRYYLARGRLQRRGGGGRYRPLYH